MRYSSQQSLVFKLFSRKDQKSVEIPSYIKFLLLPLLDTLNPIAQGISGRMARRIWFHQENNIMRRFVINFISRLIMSVFI